MEILHADKFGPEVAVKQTDKWHFEIEFKADYDAYRTHLQKY